MFSVILRTLAEREGSYASAEMQTMYSTAPADWALLIKDLQQMVK